MSRRIDRRLMTISVTVTGLAVLGACALGTAAVWLGARGLIFLYYWFTETQPN